MTDNLPAEYAVIREALDQNSLRTYAEGLAALDALAAREVPAATDAGASALEAQECGCDDAGYCPKCAASKTPPAPPAAKCAAQSALNVLLGRYLSLASSGDAGYWDAEAEPAVIAAYAALATPCQHGEAQSEIARLRAECHTLRENYEAIEHHMAEAVAELEQARKATEEAQSARDSYRAGSQGHMAEAKQLAAELRRAVDALRPYRKFCTYDGKQADTIVAAYDAKHGK